MKRLSILILLTFTATAAAQAPVQPTTPAQEAAPKPKPALKLNLDEVDPPSRPRVTFEPRDGKDPVKNLPGLGDAPATGSWERPSSAVYPPDTNPSMR